MAQVQPADMDLSPQTIRNLRDRALADVERATDSDALEQARIRYMSRKGEVPALLQGLRNVPQEDRREIGRLVNDLKQAVQHALDARKTELTTAGAGAETAFDLSLPGAWRGLGRYTLSLHDALPI